ncbi:carbohydrate-binding protein [Nocardioides dubius]|uniref:Glycosyl hydrolase family 18 protein n=1 Tax=Nocardioides dubius TaxID=317019 RepID=A0ABN1TPA9_9ACTN
MALVAGRRLSWIRLGVVVLALAGIVFTSLRGWQWFQDSRVKVGEPSWFAGYVDVTATPSYEFEDPEPGAGNSAVLAFVVADPDQECAPAWGGAYTLDEARDQLDLDRRVARLRQLGGAPMISFGGQANTELAVACDDVEELTDAYRDVVQRYEIGVIDLDVEGEALSDDAANQRRAQAVAQLQKEEGTEVWVTLPVAPHGLTDEGLELVTGMLEAGVRLRGVNVMTMNYSDSKEPGDSMAEASIKALEATHTQLDDLYRGVGDRRTAAQLWRLIGATPMLGQNDVLGEVFSLDDAAELKEFAAAQKLGRLSMWSLNRDRACSGNWPDITKVSTSCSGLNQATGAFAQLLGAKLESGPGVTAEPEATDEPTAVDEDDPATSPYQVWNAEQAYQAGERVVWRRNVYVAKWWTSGDVPDDPTVADDSAPWRLIGPVLPGEKPEPLPTVAPGTFAKWRPGAAYVAGDVVQLGDLAYVAKWWTQGNSPDAPSTQDSPSPWKRLEGAELKEARAKAGS